MYRSVCKMLGVICKGFYICVNYLCVRPMRKLRIQFSIWLETPCPLSFWRSLVCATLSSTLAQSKYTTSKELPLSIVSVQISRHSRSCVIQDRPITKPWWHGVRKLLMIKCDIRWSLIMLFITYTQHLLSSLVCSLPELILDLSCK